MIQRHWQELLRTGAGREYMQSVRAAAETLVNGATEERNAAMVRIDASLKFSRISVAVAVVLCLLAFCLRQPVHAACGGRRRTNAMRCAASATGWNHSLRTALHRWPSWQPICRTCGRASGSAWRASCDELGSLLTAAKPSMWHAPNRSWAAGLAMLERLAHLTTTLNAGIALKRRIIEDLRPSTLSKLGLVPALEILLREFGERTGVTVVSNRSR